MNIKRILVLCTALAAVTAISACGNKSEQTTTAFSEQPSATEKIHTPSYETTTTTITTASTSVATTTEATESTTKKTTEKTTDKTTAKSSVKLSKANGNQLMSVKKVFQQDDKVYITGVYLSKGKEIVEDDGEVYVDLPEPKDGKSHTFILSDNATISFSEDYGPTTKKISTNEFISKFNSINDGSGINYTAAINGDTVTTLAFYYIP